MLSAPSSVRVHVRLTHVADNACALFFGSGVFVDTFHPIPLSAMPPPIAHAPKGVCNNYPICKALQFRPKQNERRLPRLDFCRKCSAATRFCSHLGFVSPAAPSFKKDELPLFCSTHYADPAHSASRSWNLCNNAVLGCRRLSTEASRGSCYACRAREFPCRYACVGYPLHVRSKDSAAALSPAPNLAEQIDIMFMRWLLCCQVIK